MDGPNTDSEIDRDQFLNRTTVLRRNTRGYDQDSDSGYYERIVGTEDMYSRSPLLRGSERDLKTFLERHR